MSIIVCNSQHCDEQQFQTLFCVHYTIFSVVKLDLFIRALILDRILALERTTRTPRVHLVFKITMGSYQFMQPAIFANKFVCTAVTVLLT